MQPPHPDAPRATAILRLETRDLHERLDRGSALSRLMAPDLSTAELAGILRRLLALHTAIEQALGAAAVGGMARSTLLACDLQALGEDPRMPLPPITPPCFDTRDPAAMAGVRYVLEGSGLGGLLIHKQLERRFGPPAHAFTSFFRGDGARTASLWKSLCADLDAMLDTPERIAVARDNARRLFELFCRTFSTAPQDHGDVQPAWPRGNAVTTSVPLAGPLHA